MEEVHLKISGRVQGVFFRAETKEKALSLGLCGWVRNTPDGKVEALAQGPAEKLQTFIDWCGRGPDGAYVENVDEKWSTPKNSFENFEVI